MAMPNAVTSRGARASKEEASSRISWKTYGSAVDFAIISQEPTQRKENLNYKSLGNDFVEIISLGKLTTAKQLEEWVRSSASSQEEKQGPIVVLFI